jgi:ABC-type branched-subunit amino acid transport system ATPase component/ABC-type branched-subunit amino acid transport system permease subunit
VEQYLVFAILGIGSGAVCAALGVGLVMTYKGSGVINFSHAAVSIWGAFAFDEMRTSGDLVLPTVGIPSHVHLGGPLETWKALAVAVALAAALGAASYLLVFRPLRHAPLIAKIIASLGLLTFLTTVLTLNFGQSSRFGTPIFPTRQVQVGALSFGEDRIWIAALVTVLTLAVALVYRRTLFGLATRAVLDDEAALTLSRWSPTLLAITNVAGGVALTTTVMIASATISPLNPQSVGLLVIPGLAAMLLGRLVNVIPAALAGLLLGVAQSEFTFLASEDWWPSAVSSGGVTDAVPLGVIVMVLVLRGRQLPTRMAEGLERLPRVPTPMRARTIGIVGLVIAGAAPMLDTTLRIGLATSMVFVVLSLSLVVLVGLAGQISLGQLAVAGIAAFTLAKFTDPWPFPLGLIAASVMAALVAVVVGTPALRVRGAQLAVVTLASAAVVQSLVLNNAESDGTSVSVANPRIGPWDLGMQAGQETGRISFVYVVLVMMLLACAATAWLIRGPAGKRFLAVRGNEQASASIGIDVARTKMLALFVAGLLAGAGGCLLAYTTQAVSASSYSVFLGISLLVYAYIGGITGIGGALLAGVSAPGGIVYVWLSQQWSMGDQYNIIASIVLIITAILNPNGAADATRVALNRLLRRDRRDAGAPGSGNASSGTVGSKSAMRPRPIEQGGLQARAIGVRYGGVVAVDNVSVDIAPGEIVGLIGPNGAGKTSLLDALTGFAPANGSVTVRDRRIDGFRAHQRYRHGLGRTWQAGQLFEDLTVSDNVRVASSGESHVAWAMDLVGIGPLANRLPAELSGGQRKLVGVARALAGGPSILLADEPAAGLDSFESRQMARRLRGIADAGVGVLLIEHDLALVLSTCDRIYVLDQGRVIICGAPEEVQRDPAVISAYIGEPAAVHRGAS